MAKNNNLTDFLTDVADAIREKKGTTNKINPQEFSSEIKGIKTSSSMWTGHVDVEGLKAIGWDDDDIAYFQEYGVNWMEEDDEYHKVPEDNKALYGIINYDNYKDYKDVIVYLPKFDMSRDYGYQTFRDFSKMVGMPYVNINITQMYYTFSNCYLLTCIPPLDTSKASRMLRVFSFCTSVMYIPDLDTSQASDFTSCFSNCYVLQKIPKIKLTNADKLISIATNNLSMQYIELLDAPIVKDSVIGYSNHSLKECRIRRIATNIKFSGEGISKMSILYTIENEAATEAIIMTLQVDAYARLATDPDIVEALSNHPLVSLASA